MNLTHYNKNRFFGNIDDFLNQTLRSFSPSPITPAPEAYRYEEKDSYRLRLNLPGFAREEIAISLEKQILTIIAKSEREDAFFSSFERSYNLPKNINPNGINAKLENGVLDLIFKKLTKQEPRVRKIKIC
ncbi:MAG: Hsp20/alpha crystallin family protein [Akkermansiaceae bacterium]|nr:Hsp20/alpha crystallin family protein [Akkermansiaceae bacterium]